MALPFLAPATILLFAASERFVYGDTLFTFSVCSPRLVKRHFCQVPKYGVTVTDMDGAGSSRAAKKAGSDASCDISGRICFCPTRSPTQRDHRIGERGLIEKVGNEGMRV